MYPLKTSQKLSSHLYADTGSISPTAFNVVGAMREKFVEDVGAIDCHHIRNTRISVLG
ncbi:MAG: hypothetical protein MK240_05685 [Opitutales bacterium]|nr:hypothetical protein [Opitutales bacterium]